MVSSQLPSSRPSGRGFLHAFAAFSLLGLACADRLNPKDLARNADGVGYRKSHFLAQVGEPAYYAYPSSTASAPATTSTLLDVFQVAEPVLEPTGESCTSELMVHQFANSYGTPYVGNYTPPSCDFDHVVLNFTVEIAGVQYDRWGTVYLGDVEIFATSTAEPTKAGITWTWMKEVTPYLSLWKEPQTLIFELDNVVTDVYTGLLNTTLTATFFKSPVQNGGHAPADLILPVSAGKSPTTASFWTVPGEDASASLQFPRNVNRAVFAVNVKAQSSDEFWWSNLPESATEAFAPTAGSYTGYSPWREVQVFIDGQLAGVNWPYPTVFTGGVVPQLHRPIVSPDAYDLRDHEIDISPWLPLLCDGQNHTFSLQIVGLLDNGVDEASLSDTVESSWYIVGKVFLWLDSADSVTTGQIGTIVNAAPTIQFAQTITQNATGYNETVDFTLAVNREFSVKSTISTQKGNGTAAWTQSLSYSNLGSVYAYGYGAINTFSTIGLETAQAPGWDYKTSFSYPLYCNTTVTYPDGNLTLWAELDQGLLLEVQGNTVYPTGLEAFETTGSKYTGSVINTIQNATANYSRYADGTATTGIGTTHQTFYLYGLTGDGTYESTGKELYFRDVSAYNDSVTADREAVAASKVTK